MLTEQNKSDIIEIFKEVHKQLCRDAYYQVIKGSETINIDLEGANVRDVVKAIQERNIPENECFYWSYDDFGNKVWQICWPTERPLTTFEQNRWVERHFESELRQRIDEYMVKCGYSECAFSSPDDTSKDKEDTLYNLYVNGRFEDIYSYYDTIYNFDVKHETK